MRVLDLFCCAGGAAKGIWQALPTVEIVGIDIVQQPEYPFDFFQYDISTIKQLSTNFDFIWASPPCQKYSPTQAIYKKDHPDLVDFTRELLLATGLPFVIENVEQAPLRKDLLLCGAMFNKPYRRHRIFEIHGFTCEQPDHPKHNMKLLNFTFAGHGDTNEIRSKYVYAAILDVQHITVLHNINQVVPPLYSEYIFNQFLTSHNF